jgi:hypothetical protein
MYLPHIESLVRLHLIFGWSGVTLGILTGALMGMFFHNADWLGGYNTVPRRLMRLGHIAFFGMGFLNFLFALTVFLIRDTSFPTLAGSSGLLFATVTMPAICFFSAFKGINRAIFSVPVLGTVVMLLSVVLMFFGSTELMELSTLAAPLIQR